MGINRPKRFYFLSLAVAGTGISGGDRIFIEFARRWSKKYSLKIYTSHEGKRLFKKIELNGKYLEISPIRNKVFEEIFLINYLYKIVSGIKLGVSLKLANTKDTIIYSASEFWMDSLPTVILKIRYPKIKWIAGWYQTAPSPLTGHRWSLAYWFIQQPVKPLIAHFADYVLVNNEEERKQFPNFNKNGKVIVVLGAVDLEKIKNWKLKTQKLPKVYDAVFQGRFHPQKGVTQLIDIWKLVVEKRPNARLAMIGDGPLMEKVKLQITNYKIEKNVKLFGYVFDGPEKYRIFSQSKIVVHPAFYDSGGMAAAEAMAFGIPAVGFNLKAYNSYYPKGMIKVETGNLELFAEAVLELLSNDQKRKTLGKEALNMINNNWSWDKRADSLLKQLIK